VSPPASRYTADVNLIGINDAHILAIGRVPANCRVLDLGVADGSVAAILKQMGCRVWGVDIDPEAAEAARGVCEDVVIGDLSTMSLAEQFDGQQFDVVLMLDVLEHLGDPVAVLGQVAGVLADGGWGVVSLPNVAHVSMRLSLLEGRFQYTDVGLLDRTHLRFFDRAGVDDLLEQAGWAMFDLARVTRPLGTTEITIDDADPELVGRLEADPEGLTYQFVLSVAPLGSAALEHLPVLPAAAAQRVYLEAMARIAELDEEVRQLRAVHIPDLWFELAAIRTRGRERQGHLRHLLGLLQSTGVGDAPPG
jgi:2-polyprenyl-3-methyl-5-hydroxy-6-metoxy-1,4-benzoquinol methylase